MKQLTDYLFKWVCSNCFSQPSQAIHSASGCCSISGQWERNVLYQCLFRLPLWETSSSCSSSQLSKWFMEMWAISRLAPQSSPDELVPSALVTIVCFPHWPIFIQADKLNLPCFEEAIFSSFLFLLYMTCLIITRDAGLTPRNELHRTVWHLSFFLLPRLWYE